MNMNDVTNLGHDKFKQTQLLEVAIIFAQTGDRFIHFNTPFHACTKLDFELTLKT